ncbi:MAG: NAD-dependent epimerase/dehydratase family protein [Lishizhenia sp.]
MIFVTGGTGVIGSHLLYLLSKSETTPIKAIYRNELKIQNTKKIFTYYDEINGLELFNKIHWVACDILDLPQLKEEMTGAKHVYHCAALVSFQKKDFRQLIQTNRFGTANVVNLCLDLNIEKLCHVSSTAAIGKPINETKRELTEDEKWNPDVKVSGYSMSKHLAEKEVWRGIEEGLNAIIVNPSVVFGAGDWNESSLTIFRNVQKGLAFYPPGSNAFVDARDVVQIMYKLMQSSREGERYLCIGENATFKQMLSTIALTLNKKPPHIKIGKILMGFAWRLAWIGSLFSSKPAALTKSSVTSSFEHTVFSNQKIKTELAFSFKSLKEMVENAVNGKIT